MNFVEAVKSGYANYVNGPLAALGLLVVDVVSNRGRAGYRAA